MVEEDTVMETEEMKKQEANHEMNVLKTYLMNLSWMVEYFSSSVHNSV